MSYISTESELESDSQSLSSSIIVLLAATSALGPAAMQILLPALPVIRESFQVSAELAQLTLSLSMLSIALGTLTYGPLSDKYGRKPVMIAGLLITIIGSVFCVLAPTIELLIGGRIFQAFGAAVGLVVARAIVSDVYGPRHAARVIATLVMIMVVIPMLSPLLGGELMQRFGWRSVFVFITVLTSVILLFLVLRLPETLVKAVPFSGIGSMLATFLHLLSSRVFCGYAFCVSFVSVIFFAFISAAPEIMVSGLKRPPTEYGYYFVMIPLGFMAGSYLARRHGVRLGPHKMITYGVWVTITGISVALLLQIAGYQHPLFLFTPIAFAVFGNGISLPNAQASAINEFPQYAGSASGLTGFLQMGCSAGAAQLVASIYDGTALPLLLLMFAAAVLSMASFRLGVGREKIDAS